MTKYVIATILITGTIFLATSPVMATEGSQEQSQKAEQETETTCSLGSYGSTTCTTKTKQSVEQEQRQRILAENTVARSTGKVHIPVDTALDTQTAMAAVGITALGGVAYAIRRKVS